MNSGSRFRHQMRPFVSLLGGLYLYVLLMSVFVNSSSAKLVIPSAPRIVSATTLLTSMIAVKAKRPHIETRDDLIASRQKRRMQLENVVRNAKQKLEDDRTGKRKLSDEAKAQFEKKIQAYEVQIQELGRERQS
jgi:hypothetical protein